jgi:hypothetical protein
MGVPGVRRSLIWVDPPDDGDFTKGPLLIAPNTDDNGPLLGAPPENAPSAADAGIDAAAVQGGVPLLPLKCLVPGILERDSRYLDNYYPAVAPLARTYGVNPALPLGMGVESAFGTKGTYGTTKDVFGITGGDKNPDVMARPSGPAEDSATFFRLYGPQFSGAGDDKNRFLNALQGKDPSGRPVPGWRIYNSKPSNTWNSMARKGIAQMLSQVPLYEQACLPPNSPRR